MNDDTSHQSSRRRRSAAAEGPENVYPVIYKTESDADEKAKAPQSLQWGMNSGHFQSVTSFAKCLLCLANQDM